MDPFHARSPMDLQAGFSKVNKNTLSLFGRCHPATPTPARYWGVTLWWMPPSPVVWCAWGLGSVGVFIIVISSNSIIISSKIIPIILLWSSGVFCLRSWSRAWLSRSSWQSSLPGACLEEGPCDRCRFPDPGIGHMMPHGCNGSCVSCHRDWVCQGRHPQYSWLFLGPHVQRSGVLGMLTRESWWFREPSYAERGGSVNPKHHHT